MINPDQDIDVLTLQQVAALYRASRKVRLEMQAETDRMESLEKRCKERIIAEQAVDTGFVVEGYSFVVVSKPKPIIKDWEKVLDYVVDNNRWDILQKRLSDKAVMDTPDWHVLPGIERFNAKDLSVTKR